MSLYTEITTIIGNTYKNSMLLVVVNKMTVYITANPCATRCLIAGLSLSLLQKKSSIRGGPIASTTTSREYSSPLLPTRSCAINVIAIIDASTRWQIIAVRLQRAISDNVLLSICHSSIHPDTILLL